MGDFHRRYERTDAMGALCGWRGGDVSAAEGFGFLTVVFENLTENTETEEA
jgi:hypothetical protein